jgi:plastocyanin
MRAGFGASFLVSTPPGGSAVHRSFRRIVPAAVAVAAIAAVPGSASAATKSVTIDDFRFSPASLSVAKGTKVKWRFADTAAHNVTVTSGPAKFASPDKRSGTFTRKLRKAGTYKIVCTLHSGMRQTITVR